MSFQNNGRRVDIGAMTQVVVGLRDTGGALLDEPVIFEVISGDASLQQTTSTTDRSGIARVDVLMGSTPGSVRIRTSTRTGNSDVFLLWSVDPDRFGPLYHDCIGVIVEPLAEFAPEDRILDLDLSSDGSRLAFVRFNPDSTHVEWMDMSTMETSTITSSIEPQSPWLPLRSPSWSPDGLRLAYASRSDQGSQIHVADLAQNSQIIVSANKRGRRHSSVDHPVWSPDGSRIAFVANETDIWTVSVGGAGDQNITLPLRSDPDLDPWHAGGSFREPVWRDDGLIAFRIEDIGVWQLDLVKLSMTELFVDYEGGVRAPRWSPDGRIVYNSIRGNVSQVFLFEPESNRWCRIPSATVDIDSGVSAWMDESTVIVPITRERNQLVRVHL